MDYQTPEELLDSAEGEISFFRSVMRARPVGLHKHFHVLAIRNAIRNDTGRIVPVENIWAKLRTCYDLEALEGAVWLMTSSTDEHCGLTIFEGNRGF
jgi:MRG-binding protein